MPRPNRKKEREQRNRDIRRLLKMGKSQRTIAKMHGLTQSRVSQIIRGIYAPCGEPESSQPKIIGNWSRYEREVHTGTPPPPSESERKMDEMTGREELDPPSKPRSGYARVVKRYRDLQEAYERLRTYNVSLEDDLYLLVSACKTVTHPSASLVSALQQAEQHVLTKQRYIPPPPFGPAHLWDMQSSDKLAEAGGNKEGA
jgi:hypothetical protein